MMTKAYSELYLDDAMSVLGEFCAYGINLCRFDPDQLFIQFAYSNTGREFGRGNPRYTAGMSGPELFRAVLLETGGEEPDLNPDLVLPLDRSPEYWAGWIMAYYQWNKNKSYAWLFDRGLSLSEVIRMYILHEADVSAFTEAADRIIQMDDFRKESTLRRLRTYYNLTQKQLSEQSGVSLRMIQLYEQGQNDLKKAQAQVVLALADTLHCGVQELLE